MDTNLQKYMAFVLTAQYESFSRAGQKLNYTQSAISRMISDLESQWKVTLFKRLKTGAKLTEEGSKLLPYAKNLCDAFYNIEQQINNLCDIETGTIRIGTFSSAATHWLPNIIKNFNKDYPKIEFEFLLGDYDEIEKWLNEGRVDCAFLRASEPDNFDFKFLHNDQLLAVLPTNHPLCENEKINLQDLAKQPFLLLEKSGKSDVSDLFKKNNLKPDVKFVTWDDYAILSFVENGLGVSILPQLILQRLTYDVCIKPIIQPAYRKIGFAIPNKKTVSAIVKNFTEYVQLYEKSTLV